VCVSRWATPVSGKPLHRDSGIKNNFRFLVRPYALCGGMHVLVSIYLVLSQGLCTMGGYSLCQSPVYCPCYH
jgi:hypothetical protein